MALPLKNGADLYNFEMLRARLHNISAQPTSTDVGLGQIYFNTGSNTAASLRIGYCYETGATPKFHHLATLVDIESLQEQIDNIDFASSEEFTSLKERVDAFLDGEVDSDAVLDNLKEIQAFLDNYDGATSLVDLLATKADKATTLAGYGITDAYTKSEVSSLLGGYLLLTGGTLTLEDISGLNIYRSNGVYSVIHFLNTKDGVQTDVGYLGSIADGSPVYLNSGGTVFYLLHSGNFNSYAPTLTGTGASGTWGIDISGSAKAVRYYTNPTTDVFTDYLNLYATGLSVVINYSGASVGDIGAYDCVLNVGFGSSRFGRFMFNRASYSDLLYWQSANDRADGWGLKRRIAFTDSDITGYAAGLKHSNGTIGAILNSSGNVTIGGYDAAGTNYKLYVNGKARIQNINIEGSNEINSFTDNGGLSALCLNWSSAGDILMAYGGGNVGIGTITSPPYKLDVAGTVGVLEDIINRAAKTYNSPFARGYLWEGTSGTIGGLFGYGLNGESLEFINLTLGNNYASTSGICLLKGGNVGIGTVSPAYKLDVSGTGRFTENLFVLQKADAANFNTTGGYGFHNDLDWYGFTRITMANGYEGVQVAGFGGIKLKAYIDTAVFPFYNGQIDLGTSAYCWRNIFASNSVKIGDATISWDSVNSVLKVDKDFTSDGQVSSGGIADEAASGGSGLEKVVFTLEAGQTSYECEHNLATREITVSIYEEGDDYQQVLTDVYLDDEYTARIVFGSATDVAHKVVIVG